MAVVKLALFLDVRQLPSPSLSSNLSQQLFYFLRNLSLQIENLNANTSLRNLSHYLTQDGKLLISNLICRSDFLNTVDNKTFTK